MDCRKFLDSNALGLTVAALSSYDPHMRSAAYSVLAAYYSHVEGARFREQGQVREGARDRPKYWGLRRRVNSEEGVALCPGWDTPAAKLWSWQEKHGAILTSCLSSFTYSTWFGRGSGLRT